MPTTTNSDAQKLQERLGNVNHQPINVRSFTNKRVTVNYRVPLDDLDQLLPDAIRPEEIRDTGEGLLSMCACDFWVNRLGMIPLPEVHNNEMLCRISAVLNKDGDTKRAYYTLRSDASSSFLGFWGSRFSHFRKAVSKFERTDTERSYELICDAEDSLCDATLSVDLDDIDEDTPDSSVFSDVDEAAEFVLELDGSCGYNFEKDLASYQQIEYPDWDIKFAHSVSLESNLIDHLIEEFDLRATEDCTLYMENVDQTWGRSWLYEPEPFATENGGNTMNSESPLASD